MRPARRTESFHLHQFAVIAVRGDLNGRLWTLCWSGFPFYFGCWEAQNQECRQSSDSCTTFVSSLTSESPRSLFPDVPSSFLSPVWLPSLTVCIQQPPLRVLVKQRRGRVGGKGEICTIAHKETCGSFSAHLNSLESQSPSIRRGCRPGAFSQEIRKNHGNRFFFFFSLFFPGEEREKWFFLPIMNHFPKRRL